MSTTYRVVVDLSTQGSLSGLGGATQNARALGVAVGSSDSALRALGGSMASFGSHAIGAISGVVERIESMAVGFAKVAAIGALGLIAHDVVGLNSDIEQTQISLAAMFSANGLADGFTDGMRVASDQVKALHRDAAKLPVAFKDVVEVMRDITVPGAQAGMSADKVREFSATSTLAGHTLGLDSATTGREMAMLLEGRAGAHNKLGMLLGGLGGDKAQKFNKESIGDRRKDLEQMLAAYKPAMDASGASFSGVSSTFLDSLRSIRADLTKPLFDAVTRDLGRANAWLDANHDKIQVLVDDVAGKLVAAWDFVIGKLSWVGGHLDGIKDGFDKLFSEATLKKAERFAMLMGAAKLTKAFGPDMLNIGTAAGKLALGGAGAAESAAGAGGAAGAAEAAAGIGSLSAGLIGGAIAAVALAGAMAAVWGAFDAASDSASMFHDYIIASFAEVEANVATTTSDLEDSWTKLKPHAVGAAHLLGAELAGSLDIVSMIASSAAGQFDLVASAATSAIGPLGALAEAIAWLSKKTAKLGGDSGTGRGDDTSGGRTGFRQVSVDGAAAREVAKSPSLGGGGGGGGTHIAKVEIVVNQNDDPSRVAKSVVDILSSQRRFPTGSRSVPNYSASR